jgi:hypothetical protein
MNKIFTCFIFLTLWNLSQGQLFGGLIKVGFNGSITALNCSGYVLTGTLTALTPASGVTVSIPYSGGNGGTYNGQVINSTGITGLIATLNPSSFSNGSGSLVYTIIGTPNNFGKASFLISIGTQSCTLDLNVVSNVNAGQDLCGIDGAYRDGGTICGINGRGWLTCVLMGSTPPNGGTASWSVVSASDVGCVTQITGGGWVFSGKPSGNYTVRYTVTVNGVSTYDDLNICFNGCKNYTICRDGGTNQYTYNYRTCNDLSAPLQTIANGTCITVCAYPGSVLTNYPTYLTITTNNQSCK